MALPRCTHFAPRCPKKCGIARPLWPTLRARPFDAHAFAAFAGGTALGRTERACRAGLGIGCPTTCVCGSSRCFAGSVTLDTLAERSTGSKHARFVSEPAAAHRSMFVDSGQQLSLERKSS